MGDLFMQKMKTYFTRIDFDQDGAITKKDFQGMADRFIKQGKFNDTKANDLRATFGTVSKARRVLKSLNICFHRLTSRRGIHLFRHFLS